VHVLGMRTREQNAYQELLAREPMHGQAEKALQRLQARSRSRVFSNYSLWQEKGRGDLAAMTRHRVDLGLEVPVYPRHNLQLTTHRYFECPREYGRQVQATGLSLEGSLLAPWLHPLATQPLDPLPCPGIL